eukprot:TRINITY_DN261_c0_g5_i1.p1 TRINITY_DN261_c0_g5~~TRINITY_DN261_c0_g5_i1.p1  ORF type:complete len:406 (-),score=87.87 TRINITY_DN261_c0_g5_i1:182-1399(-)
MAASTQKLNKSVVITDHGSYDVLKVQTYAIPEPKAGEVLVHVKAAGLNFAEVMARMGLYPAAPPPPCVVGYEAAGIVEKLGEGVDSVAVGTRVIVVKKFGTHAEYVTLPADQVMTMPDDMSFEEGAAIPVNYLTAYHMLFRVANLRKNEKVLVHMAAGGVGIAALQLCRTVEGVETFGTASAAKHAIIKEQGCTHPIDYHKTDYEKEVRRITNNKGIDIVLDPLGGEDNKKGYSLLRMMGRLILFGAANMVNGDKKSYFNMAKQWFNMPKFEPFALIGENKSVSGVNLGNMFEGEGIAILKEEMEELLDLYRKGLIKPVISKVFSFEQAGQAHQYIQERGNIGKVILVPELPGQHPVQSSHPSAPIPVISEPAPEPAPELVQAPAEPTQESNQAPAEEEKKEESS